MTEPNGKVRDYELRQDAQGVWRMLDGHIVIASVYPEEERRLVIPGSLPASEVLELLRAAGVDPLAAVAKRCAERLQGMARFAHGAVRDTMQEVAKELREAAGGTERTT